jgi:lipase
VIRRRRLWSACTGSPPWRAVQALAERRWGSRFHVVAPDLRGHGRSNYEPPWNFPTHLADLIETVDALGIEQADWVGHSSAAASCSSWRRRTRSESAAWCCAGPKSGAQTVVALFAAEHEGNGVYDSFEAYAASRNDSPTTPPELVIEDAKLYFDELPDGRVKRRASPPAIGAILGELATPAPPPETLQVPTLLIHAPAYGLVREDHLAAYADRVEAMAVRQAHRHVDAFDGAGGGAVRERAPRLTRGADGSLPVAFSRRGQVHRRRRTSRRSALGDELHRRCASQESPPRTGCRLPGLRRGRHVEATGNPAPRAWSSASRMRARSTRSTSLRWTLVELLQHSRSPWSS